MTTLQSQLLIMEPNWDVQTTTLNLPKFKFTFDITFPANFNLNFNLKRYEDNLCRFEYIAISEITGMAIAALVQVGDIVLKVNQTNMIETFEESQSLTPVQNNGNMSLNEKLNMVNNMKPSSRVIRFLRCPDFKPSKALLQLFLDDTKVSSKFLAQSAGDGSTINTLQVLYSDPNMHSTVKKLMQGQKPTWEIKSSSQTAVPASNINTSLSNVQGNQELQKLLVTQEIGKSHQMRNSLTGYISEGVVKDSRNKW